MVYPYLTGLVAGAFTVSSLYQVFGMQRFKPVAQLALLTSLCFMIFVPMPLLLHLGHPERAFNTMHHAALDLCHRRVRLLQPVSTSFC